MKFETIMLLLFLSLLIFVIYQFAQLDYASALIGFKEFASGKFTLGR